MKEKQLMKGAAFMLLAATVRTCPTENKCRRAIPAFQSKDVEPGFSGPQQHLFLCRQPGIVRHLHRQGDCPVETPATMPPPGIQCKHLPAPAPPSAGLPETAYDNNPQLTFTVKPVSKHMHIHMLTSPIVPKEDADDPMLIGKPATGRSFWKAEKTDKGTLYTSRYGSLLIKNYPWRLVLKDADGRLLTQTRCWSDNNYQHQVKVPPFSFIKRGSDNSRSINPVFSLAPNESARLRRVRHRTEQGRAEGQPLCHQPATAPKPRTCTSLSPSFSVTAAMACLCTLPPVTCDFGCSYIGATKFFMADEAMDIFIFLGSPKEILANTPHW